MGNLKRFYIDITPEFIDKFEKLKLKTGVKVDAELKRSLWIFALEYLELEMAKPKAEFMYCANGKLKVIQLDEVDKI